MGPLATRVWIGAGVVAGGALVATMVKLVRHDDEVRAHAPGTPISSIVDRAFTVLDADTNGRISPSAESYLHSTSWSVFPHSHQTDENGLGMPEAGMGYDAIQGAWRVNVQLRAAETDAVDGVSREELRSQISEFDTGSKLRGKIVAGTAGNGRLSGSELEAYLGRFTNDDGHVAIDLLDGWTTGGVHDH